MKNKLKSYMLYDCEERLTETPSKEGFKKYKRKILEEYGFTCNQRGNEISSKGELKIRTRSHGNYKIDCKKCDEELTLRDDLKEVWNPGIAIARDDPIPLVASIKTAKIISDIHAKGKPIQKMDAIIQELEAEVQNLTDSSNELRDGWIEAAELLADTILDGAKQEEVARTRAISAETIKDAAITAIRTANVVAKNAKTAGESPVTASFMAERAGANAAVASIEAPISMQEVDAKLRGLHIASSKEETMDELIDASTRAAAVEKIKENKATTKITAVEVKKGNTAAGATIAAAAKVLAGNPRYGNPKLRQNPPTLADLTDPFHPYYDEWNPFYEVWNTPHQPADQDIRKELRNPSGQDAGEGRHSSINQDAGKNHRNSSEKDNLD